jgi:sporulation protein YlmC with PRC-barrel domain
VVVNDASPSWEEVDVIRCFLPAFAATLALVTAVRAQMVPAGTSDARGFIPRQTESQLGARDLIGTRVFGRDGEKIGEVADLILDTQRISGVVVRVGGLLGFNEKEIVLDWKQVDLKEDRQTGAKLLQVPVTNADLEASPAFKTKQ